MALIKCPECLNDISDKAAVCVYCGFPIKEYVENQKEMTTEELEKVIVNFKDGYKIIYSFDITEILQDDISLYKGQSSQIKFYGCDKNFFDNGFIQLLAPNYDVPRELKCVDKEDYINCQKIMQLEMPRIKAQKKQEELIRNKSVCPECNSLNIQLWTGDVTYWTSRRVIMNRRCNDCGKIF